MSKPIDKFFPNTFVKWAETLFFIAIGIQAEWEMNPDDSGEITSAHNTDGHVGLPQLARQWTNEFETKYQHTEWGLELEYYETIDAFIKSKLPEQP